jgi:Outer membrane protein beta-barrel domain
MTARHGVFQMVLIMLGLPALIAQSTEPPKHEIGLTLGRLFSQDRVSGATRFELGSGTALQANYGYRFFSSSKVALYGEVHMLANPQRVVTSANRGLTKDVASLFVTPGLRVKFFPRGAVSPYAAIGGGWALFEHSTTTLAGAPNPAPRTASHGVFDFGAGVDVKLWRFVGLRGEVRDFYSGNPSYNVPLQGSQHNLVVGGGFVLRFR